MKIIVEGCDGCGKTTLVNHIKDKLKYDIVHSNSETKNDFNYHKNLIDSNKNLIFDRFNLGEIVYPEIYKRKPKMTLEEQDDLMKYIEDKECMYIIFYSSNFETLRERLFKRGDTEQVLENAEKINLVFKLLAEQWMLKYKNVFVIDISEVSDQNKWFDNTFELWQSTYIDKSDKIKYNPDYITISGEAVNFEYSLNKAIENGYEIVETNSFPVQKPDLLSKTINIVIIYTAILKRKETVYD